MSPEKLKTDIAGIGMTMSISNYYNTLNTLSKAGLNNQTFGSKVVL
jgi:hypothetical protein